MKAWNEIFLVLISWLYIHIHMQLRHELSLCRVYIISGSFRAFDRRPLGPAGNRGNMMMMTTTPQDDDHDDDVIGARTNATFSHHTTTATAEEIFERRRWPAESSSSSAAAAAEIQIIHGFDTATDVNNGSGNINDWEMADPEFMNSLWN